MRHATKVTWVLDESDEEERGPNDALLGGHLTREQLEARLDELAEGLLAPVPDSEEDEIIALARHRASQVAVALFDLQRLAGDLGLAAVSDRIAEQRSARFRAPERSAA